MRFLNVKCKETLFAQFAFATIWILSYGEEELSTNNQVTPLQHSARRRITGEDDHPRYSLCSDQPSRSKPKHLSPLDDQDVATKPTLFDPQLVLANPKGEAVKKLTRSKFVGDNLGKEWMFLAVGEAVEACSYMLHTLRTVPASKEPWNNV
ncbi:hypothetical protein F2Q69_00015610 [Brassica cretica]|uniref:Uncharacterized protein n=1 Tax=Brassica cretica TaxID=69181 RepID=A0A8S9QXS5_BRACR|nr:hypothetical protein F2Q69_00015610 [Brassica cretica]